VLKTALARRIRLIGLDVDGVLSDGGLYIGRVGDHAVELKRFHSQDGSGAWLLRRAGIVLVLSSGRRSEATSIRAREMKVEEVLEDETGGGRKLATFAAMLARRGVAWDECAFVGDDLADLPLLNRVALPIAVANAVPEVKAAAALVTRRAGGEGAVREVAETILKARHVWDDLVQQYLQERGDVEAPPPRRSSRAG
jgi:3-deoxy-D-manno-octulosonate 8-phosphate phosphatase (KDO 8-P phosphatase)